MQTSARKSSLLTARFDSATGKRRPFWYGWRAIAAGAALALLAGSGIAVAASAPADAHNHKITVTCQGITIHGDNYDGSKANTVDVTIDGVTTHETFGGSYDKSFPFPNFATATTDYTANIQAFDGGYSETAGPATSQPCPTPGVAVTIPACTVAGGTVDFAATITNFDASHKFTIQLSSAEAGGSNSGPTGFTPTGNSYQYPFTGIVPGHNYTVTVTDTTTGLSGTAKAASSGCPQDSGIDVAATQCTVPGGQGGFDVTGTTLSFGRVYVFSVLDANNTVVGTTEVTADLTGTSVVHFDVAAGGTYKGTVTDKVVGASSTKTSNAYPYLPCPQLPDEPTVDRHECTTTDGQPDSTISFTASNLVPGRSYRVTVTDSNGNTIFDSLEFVSTASNWPLVNGVAKGLPTQTVAVAPGDTYTVHVLDTKNTNYVSSKAITVNICPLMPELALDPTQCLVPGGTGSIAATVTNFIPGRDYIVGVTLVQGGGTVVAPTTYTAPLQGGFVIPLVANLAPATGYRFSVTDSVVTSVVAYADETLKACPGMPSITAQATCNLLGASTVNVSLDKLEATETYTVGIVYASNNAPVNKVPDQQVPGTTPTASLKFPNVPNGNNYTVNIANATKTLTGSATFYLAKCDLPTLAFTGANPVGPAVAGIGFLQLGLMLLALNLVVRRRRTA